MSMSVCLKNFLDHRQINYDMISHRHTDTSFNAAKSAHIPTTCMVKGVLLHDEQGYLMVAVSSTREVDLNQLNRETGRQLELADEEKLSCILSDCERGAVPAIGEAYGIPTVWDEHLAGQPSFYIEAGDHERLVRLGHFDFLDLMEGQQRATISH